MKIFKNYTYIIVDSICLQNISDRVQGFGVDDIYKCICINIIFHHVFGNLIIYITIFLHRKHFVLNNVLVSAIYIQPKYNR